MAHWLLPRLGPSPQLLYCTVLCCTVLTSTGVLYPCTLAPSKRNLQNHSVTSHAHCTTAAAPHAATNCSVYCRTVQYSSSTFGYPYSGTHLTAFGSILFLSQYALNTCRNTHNSTNKCTALHMRRRSHKTSVHGLDELCISWYSVSKSASLERA